MYPHGNIEIEFDNTGLTREVWRFRFDETRVALVLGEFSYQTRETKRHNWKTQDHWSRFDRRNNTMPRPAIPGDVKTLAIDRFMLDLVKALYVEED